MPTEYLHTHVSTNAGWECVCKHTYLCALGKIIYMYHMHAHSNTWQGRGKLFIGDNISSKAK